LSSSTLVLMPVAPSLSFQLIPHILSWFRSAVIWLEAVLLWVIVDVDQIVSCFFSDYSCRLPDRPLLPCPRACRAACIRCRSTSAFMAGTSLAPRAKALVLFFPFVFVVFVVFIVFPVLLSVLSLQSLLSLGVVH
jgi:hypothetical protein